MSGLTRPPIQLFHEVLHAVWHHSRYGQALTDVVPYLRAAYVVEAGVVDVYVVWERSRVDGALGPGVDGYVAIGKNIVGLCPTVEGEPVVPPMISVNWQLG